MTTTLAYLTFPLMFLLLLLAKPLFILLYSEKWLQSVPYFQILCVAGLAYSLQSVNLQSISAIGKSKTMFIWTVIKRVVGLCFVISGLVLYGIKGLLIGVVLDTWCSYFVNIGLVSKHIGYKWSRQLLDLLPIMLVSGLSAIVCYASSVLFNLSMYPDAILRLLVFTFIYIGWSVLFKPESYVYVISTLSKRLAIK